MPPRPEATSTRNTAPSRSAIERQQSRASLQRLLQVYGVLTVAMGVAVTAIWVTVASIWILVIAAATVVHVTVLVLAYRRAATGDERGAVVIVTASVWPLTILGAVIAPESLPIVSMSSLPVALLVLPHLSTVEVRRMLVGTTIVTVIVAILARYLDVTVVADQVGRGTQDLVLMLLVPGLVAVIGVIGWQSHVLLEQRATAVIAARSRLVAAADHERRRVRRDLEDHAIRRIARATSMLEVTGRIEQGTDRALADAADELGAAIADLRRLVTTLRPAVLSEHGLVQALGIAVQADGTGTVVDSDPIGRLPDSLEGALWFGCLESVACLRVMGPGAAITLEVRADEASIRFTATAGPLSAPEMPDPAVVEAVDDRLSAVDGYAAASVDTDGGFTSAHIVGTVPRPWPAPGPGRTGQAP